MIDGEPIPLPEKDIQPTQVIFTATGIMKHVKQKYPNVQKVYLFYFRDEVLVTERQGDWDNQKIKTIYFHPSAILIKNDNKIEQIEIFNNNDYGVKFTVGDDRKLMDNEVNMLEIDSIERTNGKIKYYLAKTNLYRNFTKFMFSLMKSNKKFSFH